MKNDPPTGTGPMNRRGLAASSAEPRFLVIGKVLKAHGIGGELRIESYTDTIQRFSWLDTVYIGDENPKPYSVEKVRYHKKWVLIKLRGISDRNTADLYRSEAIQIRTEDAIPLDEDEYFLYQVVGLRALTVDGEEIGTVDDVIETKANNVFVIKAGSKEILIPDTPEVIKDIDFERRILTIELMPGLV